MELYLDNYDYIGIENHDDIRFDMYKNRYGGIVGFHFINELDILHINIDKALNIEKIRLPFDFKDKICFIIPAIKKQDEFEITIEQDSFSVKCFNYKNDKIQITDNMPIIRTRKFYAQTAELLLSNLSHNTNLFCIEKISINEGNKKIALMLPKNKNLKTLEITNSGSSDDEYLFLKASNPKKIILVDVKTKPKVSFALETNAKFINIQTLNFNSAYNTHKKRDKLIKTTINFKRKDASLLLYNITYFYKNISKNRLNIVEHNSNHLNLQNYEIVLNKISNLISYNLYGFKNAKLDLDNSILKLTNNESNNNLKESNFILKNSYLELINDDNTKERFNIKDSEVTLDISGVYFNKPLVFSTSNAKGDINNKELYLKAKDNHLLEAILQADDIDVSLSNTKNLILPIQGSYILKTKTKPNISYDISIRDTDLVKTRIHLGSSPIFHILNTEICSCSFLANNDINISSSSLSSCNIKAKSSAIFISNRIFKDSSIIRA